LLAAGVLPSAPAAGLTLLAARDPAVLLLGLPLFLLHALKLLARPGLRRATSSTAAGTAAHPAASDVGASR
jgi:hypothetical protein